MPSRLEPTAATALPEAVWSVDPERSEIGFAVKDLWGLRTVRGVFRAYAGVLKVLAGDAEGRLTIEATSLDTGNPRRDDHLRSPAFFDVERHPQIVFAAAGVNRLDGGLAVVGELTIGSARVPLEMPVTIEHAADDSVRLEARTTVSRDAAGLAWNILGMIRGDAELHARLALTRAGR